MALRLRRGTDAERLIITPADGEIIYTTDTKRIFVGDGVTVGGNPVSISSINDVGDVDITTTPPTFGQTLKWNGSAFVPGNDEQVAGTGVIEGNNYRINISADDSTIMVNTATNTLTGDLVGNVTGNIIGDVTGDVTGNLTGDVTGDLNGNVLLPDGSILLNRTNGNLYTNVGDLLIDSSLAAFFGDVDGNIRGSLFNQSLTTILVDHVNETFNGTLVGDVKGSVFGDDSTLLIDGIYGKINLNDTVTGNIKTRSVDDFPRLIMVRESAGDIAASDLAYGSIQWRRDDVNGEKTTALISGGNEAILIAQSNDGILGPDKFVVLDEGNMSIGGFVPTAKLDVRGDIKAESSITPGVYADATARDAAITVPVAGMMVFNTALQKFQGYVDDVGIAAGGLPTATPGWVDLN